MDVAAQFSTSDYPCNTQENVRLNLPTAIKSVPGNEAYMNTAAHLLKEKPNAEGP
jgi:hypothetical protein